MNLSNFIHNPEVSNLEYPKVYIIILNYNNWADTIECLESVLRNDYPNYQVIVIDNNSQNNSMEYIKKWAEGKLNVWIKSDHPLRHLSFPPVEKPIPYVFYTKKEAEKGGDIEKEKLLMDKIPKGVTTKYPLIFIQTGENLGFAGGNNVGIRYALAKDDFEYIWFLNNDTVIEKNTLIKLVEVLQKEKKSGIVGSTILYYNDPQTIQGCGIEDYKWFKAHYRMLFRNKKIEDLNKLKKDYIRVGSIYGASFIVKKSLFHNIGLLDERFFLQREESDFCYRATSKGYKIFCSFYSKVWHKEGASRKYNLELSSFINIHYYNVRNDILLAKKNLNKFKLVFHLMGPFLFLLLRTILRTIIFEKNKRLKKLIYLLLAVKDGLTNNYGKKEVFFEKKKNSNNKSCNSSL